MERFRIPYTRLLGVDSSKGRRVGGFYVKVADLPERLREWTGVNPRVVNPRNAVWRAIYQTLVAEPEQFANRNRGLTISADSIAVSEASGDVAVVLDDKKLHGLIDGGHTLNAIQHVNTEGLSPKDKPAAEVFIKVMTGITKDEIADIAGGLNRSEQVDAKSLENLRNHFAPLQKMIAKEPYADRIAYKMNEDKPIDVREVLYYLSVLDREAYDDDRHPVQLFGRKEGIIRKFASQYEAGATEKSFSILVTKAPEILWLRDEIEKRALSSVDNIGYYKTGKKSKIGTARGNRLYFQNKEVNGKVPLGWIMPMLGAFRANVVWDTPKGSFSWQMPLDKLLDATIKKMVTVIQEIHTRENSRPEYVGRSTVAWRLCYQIVEKVVLADKTK